MPLEAVPLEGAAPEGAYLEIAEARTLGGSLGELTTLLALDDDALAALLFVATIDIDVAQPYQGRKYDPTQTREFPRLAYGSPAFAVSGDVSGGLNSDINATVWDWDLEANDGAGGATVPLNVRLAVLYQANSLRTPANAARMAAIHSGLAAQSTGGLSETYLKPAEMIAAGFTNLAPRAHAIMDRYRLRTGRIL